MADIIVLDTLKTSAKHGQTVRGSGVYVETKSKMLNNVIADLEAVIGTGGSAKGDAMNIDKLELDDEKFTAGHMYYLTQAQSEDGKSYGVGWYTYKGASEGTLDKAWVNHIYADNEGLTDYYNFKITTYPNDMNSKQNKLTAGSGISISSSGKISCDLDVKPYEVVDDLDSVTSPSKSKMYLCNKYTSGGKPAVANQVYMYYYENSAWSFVRTQAMTATDETKVAKEQGATNANKILGTNDSGSVVCIDGKTLTEDQHNKFVRLLNYWHIDYLMDCTGSNQVAEYDGTIKSMTCSLSPKTQDRLGESVVLGKSNITATTNDLVYTKVSGDITVNNTGMVAVAGKNPGTYSGQAKCTIYKKNHTATDAAISNVTANSKSLTIYLPQLCFFGSTTSGTTEVTAANIKTLLTNSVSGRFTRAVKGQTIFSEEKGTKLTDTYDSECAIYIAIPSSRALDTLVDKASGLAMQSAFTEIGVLTDTTDPIYKWRVYKSGVQSGGMGYMKAYKFVMTTKAASN